MRRVPFLLVILVLGVLWIFGGGAVTLYTDWLWFQEVGFPGVFLTVLYTQALLGLLGGLVVFFLLYFNLRLTLPGQGRDVLAMVEEEIPQLPGWFLVRPLYQRLILPGTLLLSLIVGSQTAAQWEGIIRFLNPIALGVTDPLFERDVGFYIFRYPFLTYVYQFLFLSLLVTVLAVGAVYVLSRGIRLGSRGPVTTAWAKGHLLVLLAALLVVKAWGYSLDRYGLLFSPGGASYGASYSDVHATLPALSVLIALAGLAAIACVAQIRLPGIRVALLGIALWLAGSLAGCAAGAKAQEQGQVRPGSLRCAPSGYGTVACY